MNRRRVALGFGLALVVLAVLAALVGWRRIAAAISGANGRWLAVAVACSLVALTAWAGGLYRLTGAFGVRPSQARAFVAAFASGLFARSILPMSTLGGVAVTAYALSRRTGEPAERALSATATWEFLNTAASAAVALVALALLGVAGRLHASLAGVVTTVGAVVVLLAVTALIVRYRRDWVVDGAVALALVAERVPVMRHIASHDRVRSRVEEFFASLNDAAENRTATAVALAAAVVSWTVLGAAFFATLTAVGAPVPFAVALFCVPVAGLAAVSPTPGGLGGVEAAETALVLLLSDTTLAAAGAAVLCYRLTTYWLQFALAGVALAFVE